MAILKDYVCGKGMSIITKIILLVKAETEKNGIRTNGRLFNSNIISLII